MRYHEILNESQILKAYGDLLADFGMLIGFNMVSVTKNAKDPESAKKLIDMQQRFSKPMINGKTFNEVFADTSFSRNSKVIPHVLQFIHDGLKYIRAHFEQCLSDSFKQPMLDRLSKVEVRYADVVAQLS